MLKGLRKDRRAFRRLSEKHIKNAKLVQICTVILKSLNDSMAEACKAVNGIPRDKLHELGYDDDELEELMDRT